MKSRSYISLSLKPTAFGLGLSQSLCEQQLRQVLEPASQAEINVTMDMEDARYTQLTLDVYKSLQPQFPTLGIVVQTRLFRTQKDIEELLVFKPRIRLSIGVYSEEAKIAYTSKQEMKSRLLEYGRYLLENDSYVEFATHDEQLIDQILNMTEQKSVSSRQFEFQMLVGVPKAPLQQRLVDAGYSVRMYVPFATHWAAATKYLRRRLMNNPELFSFIVGHKSN